MTVAAAITQEQQVAPATRPISRAYHPTYDVATRRRVLEFLRTKDSELRPPYAVLCIVHFVQHTLGRDAACGADVRALFPKRQDALAGPLRNAHDILRRAAIGVDDSISRVVDRGATGEQVGEGC